MKRLTQILLVILAGIVVLAVVAAIMLFSTVRRPYPQTSGTITLPGLKEEVTVIRDQYGMPHIYANNLEDLFYAQGYVTAQDRFWQMEWWRYQGQGRIAELVGEPGIEPDKFIRTAGWNRMSQTTLDYYREEAPEFYNILESYAAGVNAYIGDKSPGELSINHKILQTVNEPWEIEPWTPLNTVSWGVVMSFVLANDINRELAYANLIDQFGEEAVFDLRPPYPYDSRPVIAPTDELVSEFAQNGLPEGWDTAVNWQNVNTNIIGQLPENILGAPPFVGSNNWVVSGKHTASGLPLLANDPHLAIQLPAIWYEVGLHAPGYNVVGFSFAGVPGVIIGHNDKIAWGVTNTGADVQDLYIEKINPDNPNQYEWQGEWQEMEIIEETIKVNGGEDIVLPVRLTRHGPIISDIRDDTKDVLAMRWAAQEPSRVLQSAILLNQAQNYDEFREALRYWDIPSQNFVYADVEGNIAYQMPGLTPIRKNGSGMVPVPGWNGEYEWEGWIPYEELPALFNPEQGYIVTANHAIVDEAYPNFITRDWADGDRGQRIVDLLEEAIANGPVTQADLAAIQFDSYSLLADTYLPLLNKLDTSDPRIQEAVDILNKWNRQERREETGPAIFEIFLLKLYPAIVQDEIGPENVEKLQTRNNIFMHKIANEPDSPWWDNVNTPERENREDILQQALVEALDWLEEKMPGEMASWQWGDLHQAPFVSAPLGQSGVGLLEALVNRGPFPADGGNSIVNAAGWDLQEPARVNWHPSMRMLVDMSDFDASQMVIPTGQSGHPGHPNYDDQIELWLNGKYHPMWWSETAVQSAAADTLILQPEN